MADQCSKSDNLKAVEDAKENMEEGEISPESGKVAGSTPTASIASQAASASPGEASADLAADSSPSKPIQSVPEPGSSEKTKTDGKKSSGLFKTVKNACKKVITKISPRKHDKTPIVPEGAFGVPVGAPSTAAAASGAMSRPPKGRRGTLVMESPTSEGKTLITEVSVSSDDSDFPEYDSRKASVASDTAAHSSTSNLEDSNVAKESGDEIKSPDEVKESGDEVKSPDEEKESVEDADVPMESEQ